MRFAAVLLLTFAVSVSHSQDRAPASQDYSVFEPAMPVILGPSRSTAQYNYVMTGKVRLLLFWAGADDVGGGYIRRGVSLSDPAVQLIQVLFGSDPAKAPRRINNWGAATEAVAGGSSAFFGFMKSAKTASARDAEAEIRRQKQQGQHAFEAIVSLVEDRRAISRVAPLVSDIDFNLNQLGQAQQFVLQRLNGDGPIRQLSPAELQCESARGFLQAVDELVQRTLSGKAVPQSLCYVYNARNYTLTLQKRSAVSSENVRISLKSGRKIDRTYRDLVRAQFSTRNHQSGERTTFHLLLGVTGELRGVPVQIVYQPNWWFQAVLNLDTVQ